MSERAAKNHRTTQSIYTNTRAGNFRFFFFFYLGLGLSRFVGQNEV